MIITNWSYLSPNRAFHDQIDTPIQSTQVVKKRIEREVRGYEIQYDYRNLETT